jgi:hypothetical protein
MRSRECYCCGEFKPLSDFWPTSNQCKTCLGEKRKAYIAKDPTKHRERQKINSARYRRKLVKRNTAEPGKMVFLQPRSVQVRNVTSSFPLLLGLPHQRLPLPQVRPKYPLARLCDPARFGGMLLSVCSEDFLVLLHSHAGCS